MDRPVISLVITDLDNTLYDWIAGFVPAFYEMVGVAAPLIGVAEEELLGDLQAVHRKHGDSEHPFSLLETASVQKMLRELSLEERAARLDPAFHAFNKARKKCLLLYPTVHQTLQRL